MRNPWLDIPVHRIYVYTEHGITPALFEKFISTVGRECDHILDPFVGSGVVVVEAQKRCKRSIGIDANPWSIIVSKAKTTPIDRNYIEEWLKKLEANFAEIEPLIPTDRLKKYHEENQLIILGRIRAAIEEAETPERYLLLVVFVKTAFKFSRLRKTPAPRFSNTIPYSEPIEILLDFTSRLKSALADLSQHNYCSDVTLVHKDSTKWLPPRICAVLTSPPFANNIDYVRHTMLELLWSGLAKDSHDLGAIRSLQVPAAEASTRAYKREYDDPIIQNYVKQIKGPRARGYKRMIRQYFAAMEDHLRLLARRLENEAWYTIGDSILGGTLIPVPKILAYIAGNCGLKTEIKDLGPRIAKGRNLYLLKLKMFA